MRRNRRPSSRSRLDRVTPRMSKARIVREADDNPAMVSRRSHHSQTSDTSYEELLKGSPFGCVLIGRSGGIEDLNMAAAMLLRAEKPDLIGQSFLGFLSQDDRHELIAHLTQVRATRLRSDLTFAANVAHARIPLRAYVLPPRAGDASSASWLVLVDLRESGAGDQDRYYQLFNSAPVGYMLLDRSGVVKETNETACRMLGLHATAVIGHPLILYIAPSDRSAFLEHVRLIRNQHTSAEVELSLQARDGRRVPVHITTKPSPEFGHPDLAWTVLVDLTEQIQLQESHHRAERERLEARHEAAMARARGEAKDRFLAALSHELRTPLTPAFNATTLLSNVEGLPPEAQRLVSLIRRNLELEVRLIDDLLDVTRIGRNKLQLDRSNVDFHALLRDALRMSSAEADAKQLRVSFEPEALRAFVYGDPVRLRQVVWNLINNAIKFTPAQGDITIRTSNDEIGTLKFSVTDSGIGFEPEAVGRLFIPFEQGVRSGNRGLGLGLAISQGIVEAHGGRIWAHSRGPGLGSTFEVELASLSPATLTQQRVAAATRPRATEAGRANEADRDHLRVLVVEDDPDSAETMAALLGMYGHAVETASRLAEGIKRSDESWDVIITDIGLPDGSGLSLARHVRTRPQQPRSLVALSGFGAASDVEASHEAGFDVHLTKPVDIDRVLEIFSSLPSR